MKELRSNLPLLLLLSLVPYFFYNVPNIAQSLILLGISALAGFNFYLENNAIPDYKSLFQAEIEKRDADLKSKVNELIEELESVREKQSILNLGETKKLQRESIGW